MTSTCMVGDTAVRAHNTSAMQYLVFEYVEKNLLEVLEEHPGGLELEQVGAASSAGGAGCSTSVIWVYGARDVAHASLACR